MSPKEEAGSSLFDPSTFVTGGGFLVNVEAVITESRAVTQEDTPFDAQDEDSCFLKLTFQPDAEDSEPKTEYYRFGGVDKFTPSTDHKRVVHEPDQKLIKGTKAGMFFTALVNAGFAASDIPKNDDVTFLEGLHVLVDTIDMPEMKSGGDKFKKKKEGGGPPKVVIIKKLLEPVDEKKGTAKKATTTTKAAAPAAAKKTTKAAEPAAAAGGNDAEAATQKMIVDVIKEKGEASSRLLPTQAMKVIAVPLRPAAFALLGNKEWLAQEGQPWDYDAASGKMTPNEMTAALIAAEE